MDSYSYSSFRNNLASAMDKVADTHEALIITRQKGEAAVLMSLSDYNSFMETLYLLRTPKNAERLLRATEDVRNKKKLKSRRLKNA